MKSRYFLLFILSCLFFSCGDDCIQGSNVVASTELNVPVFSEILNSSFIDIELEEDQNTSITLTAEDNLFGVFSFIVASNLLEINESATCISSNERTVATIRTNQLVLIALAGSGDIKGNVSLQNANILSGGSGDIVLEGSDAGNLSIALADTGDVDLDAILAANATIENDGTGDVYVHTNGILEVVISGTGNIYYKGNPTITLTEIGTGRLIDNN